MEFKITKEFIIEAHKAACSDWKNRIEKEFPEAFPKGLEIGKWYVYDSSLLNFQGLNHKDLILAYGFLEDKSWMETSNCGNDFKEWKEATHEEVESALIAEAKKRGYKKGVRCVFGAVKNKRIISTNEIKWNPDWTDKGGLSMGMSIIFTDGKWAEILPTEKTVITREKALKILAKKLKVSPENIEIE